MDLLQRNFGRDTSADAVLPFTGVVISKEQPFRIGIRSSFLLSLACCCSCCRACRFNQIVESLHPGRADDNGVQLSDTEDDYDSDDREDELADDDSKHESAARKPPRRPFPALVRPNERGILGSVMTPPAEHGSRPLLFTNTRFLLISFHVAVV